MALSSPTLMSEFGDYLARQDQISSGRHARSGFKFTLPA